MEEEIIRFGGDRSPRSDRPPRKQKEEPLPPVSFRPAGEAADEIPRSKKPSRRAIPPQDGAPKNPPPQPEPAAVNEEELSDFVRSLLAAARGEDTAAEEEKPEKPAEEPAPQSKTVYSGNYDSFFESLTDEEKTEFHTLFINHMKGDFGLPVYKIGEDNSEFFGKIFGALGKFRKYISTGLLSKIYNYANK